MELHRDDRQALLRKLPYLGRGWYSKPAVAYLLKTGQATWADFKWSLDATAHVEPRCLAQALEVMEDAWPEGEEHMAKLSVNALIGLIVGPEPGPGLLHAHQQPRAGRAGLPVAPVHDYVMAQEHVAVAKIRDHLHKVPPRYVVALKTDCLVFQDLPKKFLPAVRELTAWKHQDGTPVYRFEECKRLEITGSPASRRPT